MRTWAALARGFFRLAVGAAPLVLVVVAEEADGARLAPPLAPEFWKIGRASCRERV